MTLQVGDAVDHRREGVRGGGTLGIDAVQFRLTSSVTGTVTLQVTVNGADSNTVMLAVQ